MLKITDLKEGMTLYNDTTGDTIEIISIRPREKTAYCNVYNEFDETETTCIYDLRELTKPYINVWG